MPWASAYWHVRDYGCARTQGSANSPKENTMNRHAALAAATAALLCFAAGLSASDVPAQQTAD
jgi:hypothetical protein